MWREQGSWREVAASYVMLPLPSCASYVNLVSSIESDMNTLGITASVHRAVVNMMFPGNIWKLADMLVALRTRSTNIIVLDCLYWGTSSWHAECIGCINLTLDSHNASLFLQSPHESLSCAAQSAGVRNLPGEAFIALELGALSRKIESILSK